MPKQAKAPADLTYAEQAGLMLLQPQTDAAWEWLKHRTQHTRTNWLGRTLVVEIRYYEDIITALRADGVICQNA
jgi:hypothetical protein